MNLERFGIAGATLEPLLADASTRRYYRVKGTGSVLMVRTDAFLPETDPCCTATSLYRAIGIYAPEIRATDGRCGLLLIEDLGDDLLAGRPPAEFRPFYERAVGIILRLQRDGTPRLIPPLPAAEKRLDTNRLHVELRFFHRHYVRGLRGLALPLEEEARLDEAYATLARAAWISDRPALAHRDFHARNLLIQPDGSLGVVDHQDSRWGNRLYDLASLLRDPYVALPEGLEEEMLALYARESGDAVDALRGPFDLVAAQRNLKAAGTYAYQMHVLGRDLYSPSLGPTLAHARAALARTEEGRPLLELLEGRGLLSLRS